MYTPVIRDRPLKPLNNLRFCREACSGSYLYCIDGNNELLPVDKDQACYHSCIIEQNNRILNYPSLYEQIGLQYETCVNACKISNGPVKKVRAIINLRSCYEDMIRYEWCISAESKYWSTCLSNFQTCMNNCAYLIPLAFGEGKTGT